MSMVMQLDKLDKRLQEDEFIQEICHEVFMLEMKDRWSQADHALMDHFWQMFKDRERELLQEDAQAASQPEVTEAGQAPKEVKGQPEVKEIEVKKEAKEAKPKTKKKAKKAAKENNIMENNNTVCTGVALIDNIQIEALNKISEFQALIKSQLAEGHDYGVIPGTSKPTLLKPGAEKILMLMGLTSQFDIIDSTRDFDKGFFQYQVKCKLFSNGLLITEGLGACNTKEKKYIKQDAFTIDNTILKMAKKRAMIDATLLVASLSQIFTQDVEDMGLSQAAHAPASAAPAQEVWNDPAFAASPDISFEKKPTESTANTASAAASAPVTSKQRGSARALGLIPAKISEAQSRRMYALSKGNKEICRSVCAKYGYKSSKDVARDDYEDICEEILRAATPDLITNEQRKHLWDITGHRRDVFEHVLELYGYRNSKEISNADYGAMCGMVEEIIKKHIAPQTA